jgi:internalin A
MGLSPRQLPNKNYCHHNEMNPTETKNMTRDEAMRRIDLAAQENWTKLNLSGLDLEEVPSEIGKCTQLETFVLMESQFMAFHEKRKERGKRLTKFSDAVL